MGVIHMSEEAKAIQEVAKTAGKAIDASQNLGAFAKQVFGDLVVDSVGLVGDKLKYYRLEKEFSSSNNSDSPCKKKALA